MFHKVDTPIIRMTVKEMKADLGRLYWRVSGNALATRTDSVCFKDGEGGSVP